MKTFQQPLTAGEEAYYIRLLREGTVEESRQAREILVERNLRLVAHIAKKYQNVEEDMEDLISIGCIGLIKAVNSFDSGKGRRYYFFSMTDAEIAELMKVPRSTVQYRRTSSFELLKRYLEERADEWNEL